MDGNIDLMNELFGGSPAASVAGVDDDRDDVDVAGVGDQIATALLGENLDVGAVLQRAMQLAMPRSRRPATQLKLATRAAQRVIPHIQRKTSQTVVNLENKVAELQHEISEGRASEIGRRQGVERQTGNQIAFLDSGETEILADASFGPIEVKFDCNWVLIDFIVSQPVADQFIATNLKVGAWPLIGLGSTVSGNGGGTGLDLSCFTPTFFGNRPKPFAGREYSAGTTFTLTVKNRSGTTANRFTASLIYQLDPAYIAKMMASQANSLVAGSWPRN